MAARRPLVIVAGVIKELPTGDTVATVSSTLSILNRSFSIIQVSISTGLLTVLKRDGVTTINVPV